MKKNIIYLALALTLSSCVYQYDYTPSSLTSQGQSMFYSWYVSMKDCNTSHAQPAILLENYQTLPDEAHRQDFINKYFPGKVIIQDGDKWLVLNNLENPNPIIMVEYVVDTAFVTTYDIGSYTTSDFDFSQDGVINSKLIKNGENFDFQLIRDKETELNLKLNNLLYVYDGSGFYYIKNGDNSNIIKMEFEILEPLYYSSTNIIIDGQISIKATNFDGKIENVNVKFYGNYVEVTFRGVTEKVSFNQLTNSDNYYYNNNYYY